MILSSMDLRTTRSDLVRNFDLKQNLVLVRPWSEKLKFVWPWTDWFWPVDPCFLVCHGYYEYPKSCWNWWNGRTSNVGASSYCTCCRETRLARRFGKSKNFSSNNSGKVLTNFMRFFDQRFCCILDWNRVSWYKTHNMWSRTVLLGRPRTSAFDYHWSNWFE